MDWSCSIQELERLEKDPNNAVADFSLIVEIPANPRTASANLLFDAKKEDIISRFADFCGHGATIKVFESCGIGEVYQLVSPISYP